MIVQTRRHGKIDYQRAVELMTEDGYYEVIDRIGVSEDDPQRVIDVYNEMLDDLNGQFGDPDDDRYV